MRRLALLFATVLLAAVAVPVATPTPVAAQAGMPDMSKAPPDIQAIWKKVMSGGLPTQAEAAKLQAYMDKHRVPVTGDSVTGGSGSGGSGSGESVDDCPAKSPLLAQLPTSPPGTAAASQLLAQLRSTYADRESADGQSALDSIGKSVTDATKLNWLGAELVVGQYPGAAVAVYADAAAKGGPNAQLSWSGLGSALEEAGDDAHAVAAFRRALALGPRNALDVYGLGVAYADLGDLPKGIALLTEATSMAPKFGLAWEALGRSQSCIGAMAMAAASMKMAQEVDWTAHREKVMAGAESDDDHVEAKKPFPKPPGVGPNPPPVPPAFPWTYPTIPDQLTDATDFSKHMLGEVLQYHNIAGPFVASEQKVRDAVQRKEDAWKDAQGLHIPPEGFFLLDISLTNAKEAEDAYDRVDHRMFARLALIQRDYHDQMSRIAKAYSRRFGAIQQQYTRCQGDACGMTYCRAGFKLASSEYDENRAAGAVYVGGMTGLSQEYDKVMRAWFRYANDPVTEVDIDFDRRKQIMAMEGLMYDNVAMVGDWERGGGEYSLCVQNGKLLPPPASAADAAGKPGPCKAKEADAVVIDIYSDCRSFRLIVGAGVKLRFEFHGATKGHHGSLFIGPGVGVGKGVPGYTPASASAWAGMQANWGENGRITTAGIGLKGQGHAFGNSFQVNETINGRSSGPAQEGSVAVAVAPPFVGKVTASAAWGGS
jgi:tetratricopeptide (TPR) repeat protein